MTENYITTELAKYNLPDAKIAEMKADYLPLKVTSIEDMDNYLICKKAHQEVKEIRINIEKRRKELKASSLEFGRAIDGEAKRLTQGVAEVEDHLLNQRKVVEDEKKRIQEDQERKEREEQECLRREEEERLESIRKEQEEKERKLQEEREKIEVQRRANEEEKERLAREKERAEREKREAEEAKKRAEQEEKNRIEREKRHAEEVERAKKEAAERAIREQKEREVADKLKVEKAKLLAPDKEKLLVFVDDLDNIVLPQIKTPDAKVLLATALSGLNRIIVTLRKEARKL